uniref:Uncharacterized protein n=1 Tax=Manihot esculenta TaxID=3983 RepID=A0A2C9U448_MANES
MKSNNGDKMEAAYENEQRGHAAETKQQIKSQKRAAPYQAESNNSDKMGDELSNIIVHENLCSPPGLCSTATVSSIAWTP